MLRKPLSAGRDVPGGAAPSAVRFWPSALRAIKRLSGTRANGQLGLCADIGVALALLGAGFGQHPRALIAIGCAGAGLVVASFAEYCIHRWLFHGGSPVAMQMFRDGHERHHAEPLGYDALPFFLPPLAMLLVAAGLARVTPPVVALLFAGGIASGYAAYGLSHSLIHNVRFRRALPRRWAAGHHVHHHHPDRNFGVTSPLWDIVLGTRRARAKLPAHTAAR